VAEFDGAILEIDQELTFDDVEKFIVVVVFVPVIFSLDDTETDDGLVHLTESLVIPFEGAGIGESFRRLLRADGSKGSDEFHREVTGVLIAIWSFRGRRGLSHFVGSRCHSRNRRVGQPAVQESEIVGLTLAKMGRN
jgi:hypothetical protein